MHRDELQQSYTPPRPPPREPRERERAVYWISTSIVSAWRISSPRATEWTISRRISGVIWWCTWYRSTSRSASFCSDVRSDLYLCVGRPGERQRLARRSCRARKSKRERAGTHRWTKTRNDWCHRTGIWRVSRLNRRKWNTSASTTLYGSAYFLSSRTRMKTLFGPVARRRSVRDGPREREGEREGRGRTGVLHLSELEEGRARVQDGDADLGQDRAEDGRLAQGAGAALRAEEAGVSCRARERGGGRRKREERHLAQREQEALEERRGLVDGLLERHVRVHAQLARLANLLAHLFEQDLLVELLALLRVEVGRKDARRGVRRVRRPRLGVGEHDERGPHGQRREDLERLGERARLVPRQELADPASEACVRVSEASERGRRSG